MEAKPFIIGSITMHQPINEAISTVINICKQLTSKKIIIGSMWPNIENAVYIRHILTCYKGERIECKFIIDDVS